jgi:hypothetical protein
MTTTKKDYQNKPFLSFYEDSMESYERMYDKRDDVDFDFCSGLCDRFDYIRTRETERKIFRMVSPTVYDIDDLEKEGYSVNTWASGVPCRREDGDYQYDTYYKFTPLRQTIVLLCAAINDEL